MTLAARYLISGLIGVGIARRLGNMAHAHAVDGHHHLRIVPIFCSGAELHGDADRKPAQRRHRVCLPLTVALVGILVVVGLTIIGLLLGSCVLTIMSARLDGADFIAVHTGLMPTRHASGRQPPRQRSCDDRGFADAGRCVAAGLGLAADRRASVERDAAVSGRLAYTTLFRADRDVHLVRVVQQIGAVRRRRFTFSTRFSA